MKHIRKRITLLFVVVFILVILVACGKEENNSGKAIPIYQGMAISETISNVNYENKVIRKSLLLNNGEVDQDDPYDNDGDKTIEDEVKKSIDVTTEKDVKYFPEPNKDLFLTVKLLNPDHFVILSFTLNGTFYQSYQFQDGSDSENLILKVNSGDVSGIKEFTIDAIKYIDGTEIKDVTYAGERTIKVGVTYQQSPLAQVTNLNVTATSLSFEVLISDINGLIETSGNILKVVLYDGNTIVQEKNLILGSNQVQFDQLNIGTLYQYAIVTKYDLLNGNGDQIVLLYKEALYTKELLLITDLVITNNSITFDLETTDKDITNEVISISLYKNDEIIEVLQDLNLRSFEGLLSDNEYIIKIIYRYEGLISLTGNREISLNFKTSEKIVPIVNITNSKLERTIFSFDLDIIDPDNIYSMNDIQLRSEDKIISQFYNLDNLEIILPHYNITYYIDINYTYDLNNGSGVRTGKITIKNIKAEFQFEDFRLNIDDFSQIGITYNDDIPNTSSLIGVSADGKISPVSYDSLQHEEILYDIGINPFWIEAVGNYIFIKYSENVVYNARSKHFLEPLGEDIFYIIFDLSTQKMHSFKNESITDDMFVFFERLELEPLESWNDVSTKIAYANQPLTNGSPVSNGNGSVIFYDYYGKLRLFTINDGSIKFIETEFPMSLGSFDVNNRTAYFDYVTGIAYYYHSILQRYIAYSVINNEIIDANSTISYNNALVLPDGRILVNEPNSNSYYWINDAYQKINYTLIKDSSVSLDTSLLHAYQFNEIGEDNYIIARLSEWGNPSFSEVRMNVDHNLGIITIDISDLDFKILKKPKVYGNLLFGYRDNIIYQIDMKTQNITDNIDLSQYLLSITDVFLGKNEYIIYGIGNDMKETSFSITFEGDINQNIGTAVYTEPFR